LSDALALHHGPWSSVQVDGELARAEREWLHTNGAGAYAMSTLALMHTRRHHGLLVASLDPPLGRHVILSHAETHVSVADRTFKLSTHQFPGVAPTPGYRHLKAFFQDPLPRWQYALGKGVLERTLALARGKNAVVFRYHWSGRTPARLSLMPLMPLRPAEHLAREHGGMVQTVTLRSGEVQIQPLLQLPPISFGHSGVFMGSPDWWRRFEYAEDLRRYSDFQEDMWTPGTFEITLEPDGVAHIVAAVGTLPSEAPEQIVEEARRHLLAQDPGAVHTDGARTLWVAADAFCHDACQRRAVVAGYPWLRVPLRDWLIALPGLMLDRGRVEEAMRSLELVISLMQAGLLPAELGERGQRRPDRSPDSTLWLFQAARALAEKTGLDHPFVRGPLYSALVRAFVRLLGRRTHQRAWVTSEGLLAIDLGDAPGSWMDARALGKPVTPRNGLCIEHQALWFSATRVLGAWARYFGHESLAHVAERAGHAVRAGVRDYFWCNETDAPFDCLSTTRSSAESWADASVRPNALIALALAPELFEQWQADAIVARAKSELLTPRGLRTLAPSERAFRGYYEGGLAERESALHQGTVWPFLLGFYVRAVRTQNPGDEDVRQELLRLVENASSPGPVIRQVAQIADGEEPHRVRGCPAQAWSVALLLHALEVDLGGV
jgi:predicted glycogen debranching enzyme